MKDDLLPSSPNCSNTFVVSSPFRVLNLYACLGGNRYKWDEVANIEVTAVELDAELARMYQERFPNDKVIVADAHKYLQENYQNFDFIWCSPPCPTHSKLQLAWKNMKRRNFYMPYPDMTLYQEIIFLDNYFDGKYCVENVIPFYEPLIPAQKRGRHLYWCNFKLPNELGERKSPKDFAKGNIKTLSDFHDFDFKKYKGKQRLDVIAKDLVDYEAGKTIFATALGVILKSNVKQPNLFEGVI
jgi:DNA (cytosine-5)-methyltransferase 1